MKPFLKSVKLKESIQSLNKNMSDPDSDGYPNVIDCSDRNRRKQGIISKIKEKYQEYKEKEPERRQQKLEKEKHRLEVQQIREKTSSSRFRVQQGQMKVQSQRHRLMSQRQKSMGQMPSMFGSSSVPTQPISLWTPAPGKYPNEPPIHTKKGRVKRKTRGRKKRR